MRLNKLKELKQLKSHDKMKPLFDFCNDLKYRLDKLEAYVKKHIHNLYELLDEHEDRIDW